MHLKEGEKILKIYRYHWVPFVFDIFKTLIALLPFYLTIFYIREFVDKKTLIIWLVSLIVLSIAILIYVSYTYWLNKLILTNIRIIHVNWERLFCKKMYEIPLESIAEIRTEDNGVINGIFKTFDFGKIVIEGVSNFDNILFENAPEPNNIEEFISKITEIKLYQY